jgi:hypothetical protein
MKCVCVLLRWLIKKETKCLVVSIRDQKSFLDENGIMVGSFI